MGQALGLHHKTVQRCVKRAVAEGAMAALDDRPRPGREPSIALESESVAVSCRKAKELGYPHELWTTRLLARHAREHVPAEGHPCLANLAQGTLCKILDSEVKPHQGPLLLEKRDPEFAKKMAEVLCVYRKVRLLKKVAARSKRKPNDRVAIVSYDEKPGIQAIATTFPDLLPEPGVHATFARDLEYKGHGTVTLLAGNLADLVTGKVHALVEDRRRSREFVAFLKRLDKAYSADTAIHLILDNHSAHISRETKAWLAEQPTGRFKFTLTPQAWFLAQPRRGLLLQAGPLRAAPHPRLVQTRNASWPQSTSSIAIPSSTLGPAILNPPPFQIFSLRSAFRFRGGGVYQSCHEGPPIWEDEIGGDGSDVFKETFSGALALAGFAP